MSYADKDTVVSKTVSFRAFRLPVTWEHLYLLFHGRDAAGNVLVLVASTLKAVLELHKSSCTGDKWG